jgi:hypothetical protein
MDRRICLALGIVIAIAGGPPLLGADEKAPGQPPGAESEFRGKVLYVVGRPLTAKDENPTTGLFEQARVVRLGDRYFLAAVVADYGPELRKRYGTGRKVWMPLSEILQMTEFDSAEEALKFFQEGAKEGK